MVLAVPAVRANVRYAALRRRQAGIGGHARVPATTHSEKARPHFQAQRALGRVSTVASGFAADSDHVDVMPRAVDGSIEVCATQMARSGDDRQVRMRRSNTGVSQQAANNWATPTIQVSGGKSGSSSRTPDSFRMRAMASREDISPARKRCTQRRTTKECSFCR